MKHRLLKSLALGLLMLPVGASSASAYEFISNCAPNQGAVWIPSRMPVQYYINQNGTADMPFSQMQQIITDSFAAWSDPCESAFASQYVGTTGDTAYTTNKEVVFSWAETQNEWPPQLGDPFDGTIAVTLSSVGGCRIYSAPIIFNGIAHTYTDQCNLNGCANGWTDLQSIATHEIGHLLGLTHTPVQSATMYYAYTGGNNAASLASDDLAGVNALYPSVCSCINDSDCIGQDEQCINNRCEEVPCMSDNDCDAGLACDTVSGDCVIPPCNSDAECGPGFSCQQGICRSSCPVCRDCNNSNVCGPNAVCSDANGDGAGECIVFCDQQGGCPGDGACFQITQQGQDYFICLNADVNQTEICPDTYVCEEDPCDGVQCTPFQYCDNGQCIPFPQPDMGMRPERDMGTVEPPDMNPPMPDMNMTPIDMNTPMPDMGQMNPPDMGTPPRDMGQPQPSDMGTGPGVNNTTPGNNNGTPPVGNNGTGTQDEEEEVLLIIPPPKQEDPEPPIEETCSVGSTQRPSSPGGLMLLLLGVLGLVRRRAPSARRRQSDRSHHTSRRKT